MVGGKNAATGIPIEDVVRAFATVSDAVVLLDDDGNVTFMNDEASKVTGVTAEDALGRNVWEVCVLLDQDSREPLHARIAGIESQVRTFVFPISTAIISTDGIEKLVRGSVHLSDAKGSPIIRSIVFRDVSARWQIDIASQRAQKSQVLRLLVDGVAKNLDDLLTVLLAKLAKIHTNQNDRPVVLRSIREAQVVIDRISSLVSSLSPERYWQDTEKGISLVANVISGTVANLKASRPGIQIEVSYPDRTGYAGVPPDLIEQLLLNLLLNASESMGGEGRIRLSACRVELEEKMKLIRPGEYVMLCVSDNGCGVPEEDLLRVFDPFFSTKGKGRGLGLSAVYSIIHSNNGYIVINSMVGQGTIISVFIPAAENISTETAEDFFPRVGVAGFGESDQQLLLHILDSIGCDAEVLQPNESGEYFPEGGMDPSHDLLIFQGDLLDPIKSQSGKWLPPRLRAVAVWNTEDDLPENTDRSLINVRGPLRIDCISEAVAKFFWHREVDGCSAPSEEIQHED